jgi:hypothetical protein
MPRSTSPLAPALLSAADRGTSDVIDLLTRRRHKSVRGTYLVHAPGTSRDLAAASLLLRAATSISAPTSESTSRYDLLGDLASNNASGNSAPGKALVKMFRYGSNRGHEFSVILRVIGGQQIRLNNIVLEGDLAAK